MIGHSIVLVVGVKGGVGTTTLTAGLLYALQGSAAGVDLTLSNDLSTVMGQNALSIASVVRRIGQMPQAVNTALRRARPLLALDLEGKVYAERLSEFLRLLATRRPVVIDAGYAGAMAVPADPVLHLASHILLVAAPDVRAVVRAEQCVKAWQAFEAKIALIENKAGSKLLLARAFPIPKTEATSLSSLMKGPAGQAIRTLATEVLPGVTAAPPGTTSMVDSSSATSTPDAHTQQRGILRSIFKTG